MTLIRLILRAATHHLQIPGRAGPTLLPLLEAQTAILLRLAVCIICLLFRRRQTSDTMGLSHATITHAADHSRHILNPSLTATAAIDLLPGPPMVPTLPSMRAAQAARLNRQHPARGLR